MFSGFCFLSLFVFLILICFFLILICFFDPSPDIVDHIWMLQFQTSPSGPTIQVVLCLSLFYGLFLMQPHGMRNSPKVSVALLRLSFPADRSSSPLISGVNCCGKNNLSATVPRSPSRWPRTSGILRHPGNPPPKRDQCRPETWHRTASNPEIQLVLMFIGDIHINNITI